MTDCHLQLRQLDGYALRGGDTGGGAGLGELSEDDELSLGHADFEIPVGHPSGDLEGSWIGGPQLQIMSRRHQNAVETESTELVLEDQEGTGFGRHQKAVKTESTGLIKIIPT